MVFTDMDGVVAKYERASFVEREDGSLPFMDPGIHYFSSRIPDQRIIDAYERLSKNHDFQRIIDAYEHLSKNHYFFVLSNIVDDPTISNEHEEDKKEWVKKYMPFVDINSQLYVIKEPKYKTAERLLGLKLEKTDILISDFNNDIYPWIEAGGTAIKYLNGINDPNSYRGPQITQEMEPEEIERYIEFFVA